MNSMSPKVGIASLLICVIASALVYFDYAIVSLVFGLGSLLVCVYYGAPEKTDIAALEASKESAVKTALV